MQGSHRFLSGLSLLMYAGCAAPGPTTDLESQRKMLTLLMPSRIEIVEPFTRAKSFDSNSAPDGIELLVRAVNFLDNPGLMIVGTMRVELYEFVPGSGEDRGKRLEQWNIDLTNTEGQRRFWNSLTQMYEFRLGVDPTKIPAAQKYVLSVTYNSPLGEHFSDDCRIEYRSAPGPLGGVRASPP